MSDTHNYQQQLDTKIQKIRADFAEFNLPDLTIFTSPPSHYRMRAEFKIWQAGEFASYAMFAPGPVKTPIAIETFNAASTTINRLMPLIMDNINQQAPLRYKLFEAHFLTSTIGEALVSLVYHTPLTPLWQAHADELCHRLGINIVGRSRGQKIILGRDYVNEEFIVQGRKFHYRHSENSFTQPNGFVCEHMLNWAAEYTQHLGGDLLELYCGNGNFTLPLTENFDQVLATEVAKVSVADAHHNIARNNIPNLQVLRMSSAELTDALTQKRQFRRLGDLDLNRYQFSTVFVDPPRSGLDTQTLDFIKRFPNIMYISCNPESLKHNLQALSNTHHIQAMALFDQFPFTDHLETGVLLAQH